MSLKIFRIITLIFLIYWMSLIFFMSSQTAVESNATSSGLSQWLFSLISPKFNELSVAEQKAIISEFSFFVRKTAHFIMYAVLGVLSFLSLITYKNIPYIYRTVFSVLICILYAIGDEIHQLFISGRSGEIRDILLDSSGSFLAILLCFILVKKIKKIYNLII